MLPMSVKMPEKHVHYGSLTVLAMILALQCQNWHGCYGAFNGIDITVVDVVLTKIMGLWFWHQHYGTSNKYACQTKYTLVCLL